MAMAMVGVSGQARSSGQLWVGVCFWGAQLQQRKAIFSLPEHFLSSCSTPLQRQLKCVNMADLGAELSVGAEGVKESERARHT